MTKAELLTYITSLDSAVSCEKNTDGTPKLNCIDDKTMADSSGVKTYQWNVFYRRPDNYESSWQTVQFYVVDETLATEKITLKTSSLITVPSNLAATYLTTNFDGYHLSSFDHVSAKGEAQVTEKLADGTFDKYSIRLYMSSLTTYTHGKIN